MAVNKKLIESARLARSRARAPYSGYAVGSAILGGSGAIYLGCNVESGAYPTTMCAERIAIYNAISAGEESLQALAIVTKDGGTPCGACRQGIYEQCGDIPVYLASE
ncbi:MAG: cytidine deaminase, partial [Candidatus Marinimicrobia bacterium]|nr:cytidine deaminase [Candidatus Neomarinimicrobiota bacterium]